jgi:hypothetical protein
MTAGHAPDKRPYRHPTGPPLTPHKPFREANRFNQPVLNGTPAIPDASFDLGTWSEIEAPVLKCSIETRAAASVHDQSLRQWLAR